MRQPRWNVAVLNRAAWSFAQSATREWAQSGLMVGIGNMTAREAAGTRDEYAASSKAPRVVNNGSSPSLAVTAGTLASRGVVLTWGNVTNARRLKRRV